MIKVLSANVFTGVLDELAGDFERTTGHKVTIVYGSAGEIRNRVQVGEFGDMTILTRPMMDEVLRQGRVTPGSIIDLARSAVGVAVRKGAPKPDISSVDAFKRALLAAESVSYPDPARGGATGVLFARVLERLGMTGEMKLKTRIPPAGQFGVDVVARGDAEISISQPMEVLGQPGVELVGLLPLELQDPPNFVFSAGLLVVAKEPQAAKALIQFLSGPSAASMLKANGMSPARPSFCFCRPYVTSRNSEKAFAVAYRNRRSGASVSLCAKRSQRETALAKDRTGAKRSL